MPPHLRQRCIYRFQVYFTFSCVCVCVWKWCHGKLKRAMGFLCVCRALCKRTRYISNEKAYWKSCGKLLKEMNGYWAWNPRIHIYWMLTFLTGFQRSDSYSIHWMCAFWIWGRRDFVSKCRLQYDLASEFKHIKAIKPILDKYIISPWISVCVCVCDWYIDMLDCCVRMGRNSNRFCWLWANGTRFHLESVPYSYSQYRPQQDDGSGGGGINDDNDRGKDYR